jgi:hypothetical protein
MIAGRHFSLEFRRSQTAAIVRNDIFNSLYPSDPNYQQDASRAIEEMVQVLQVRIHSGQTDLHPPKTQDRR